MKTHFHMLDICSCSVRRVVKASVVILLFILIDPEGVGPRLLSWTDTQNHRKTFKLSQCESESETLFYSEIDVGGMCESDYELPLESEESQEENPIINCTSKTDSYNNYIHYICNGWDMTQTPPPLTNNYAKLIIECTSITKLKRRTFGDVQIENIELNNNKIREISPNSFEGLQNVRRLTLNNNQISYILLQNFKWLNRTTTLELKNNQINLDVPDPCENKVTDEIDPVLDTLFQLDFSGNPLGRITPLFFAALRNSPLTFLYLNNCNLRSISPDSFQHLSMLFGLEIDQNPNLMPNLAEAFSGIKSNLSILRMRNNELRSIPKDAIEIVKKHLEDLWLTGNPLINLDDSSFPTEMFNLKSLYIESCKLERISQFAFESMPNLLYLHIKDNRFKVLPDSFSILPNLYFLDLSKDDLVVTPMLLPNLDQAQELSGHIFRNQSKLNHLRLNNLNIGRLVKEHLDGLAGLSQLELNNTKLSIIDDYAFEEMKNLEILTLDKNPLELLNKNSFYGLGKLSILSIKNCNLHLPLDKLPENRIKSKNSTENKIDFVTTGTMLNRLKYPLSDEDLIENGDHHHPFRHLTRLTKLDLSHNFIRQLHPLLFANNTQLRDLELSSNQIVAWNSRIFSNNEKLTFVNIANNKIMSLTKEMLEDITMVKKEDSKDTVLDSIDLSYNPLLCDSCLLFFRDWALSDNVEDYTVINIDTYECYCKNTKKYIELRNLTWEECPYPNTTSGQGGNNDNLFSQENSGSNPIIIMAISLVCISSMIALAVFGYKKRLHLRYYFLNINLRLNKLRTMDEKFTEAYNSAFKPSFQYDVFLSYNHQDNEFIQDELVPRIEGEKDPLRMCIHERDFEPGVLITENIVECVGKSRKVLIVGSKSYLESQWCMYELRLVYNLQVQDLHRSFILVLLEEIPSEMRSKILNFLIGSRTYLLWPGKEASENDKNLFWKKLRNALKAPD